MERLFFALDLKDDPAAIAEYESWHSRGRIWPEIVAHLRAVGVEELEIHRCGNRLVMVMEVPEGTRPKDHVTIGATTARVAEWEELMWQFQRPLPFAQGGEKWVPMARIFSLKSILAEQAP
jgi:L-rhamnose mutarotase